MGRISYSRQTQVIEEVKALEEQHYKEMTVERLFGTINHLRETIEEILPILTNSFRKLPFNRPEYGKYVVMSEEIYLVKSNNIIQM